jgi:MYXO-CTERM domain-containing protein
LNGDRAEDEFTDTLPNGKVWGGLVTMTFGPGVVLQEFDPEANTATSVMPPPDTGNPYPIGYVNLPNGQVMVTCERNDWIATLDSQPKDEWRPTVTSVEHDDGNTYTLTGTQLSGLINGADEGDDMSMAENYPIVWLTNGGGDAYYCRTFNFSKMTPAKGSAPQTCQFTTPDGLPEGMYSLHVSSVGVQMKDPVPFTVGVGGGPKGTGGASASTGGASSMGSGGMGVAGGSTASAGGSTAATGTGGVADVSQGGVAGSAGASSNSTGAGGESSSGTSGAGPVSGGTTGKNGAAPKDAGAHDSSGCGCRTVNRAPSTATTAVALLAFAGLSLRRVRRRSRV